MSLFHSCQSILASSVYRDESRHETALQFSIVSSKMENKEIKFNVIQRAIEEGKQEQNG